MSNVYHLSLTSADIQGAKHAILPGDPARAASIAHQINPNSKEIAHKREFRTFLGRLGDTNILVTSTGIGGPSTAIVIDELAKLGVRTFIRIGTTGAIQEDIDIGDVIITNGSVRLDGTSTHYAPIEYPAVASHHVTQALIQGAQQTKVKAHVGITASCDTFYPGQERYDSYSGYVRKSFQNMTEEWRNLHVLNYEMESATLLTVCSAMGLHSGCVTGVVVNRTRSEAVSLDNLEKGETHAITVGIKGLEMLLS